MRQAAKKDSLHVAVGHIFRQCGWGAIDMSGLGDGHPDWAFFREGHGLLAEVKSPGWDKRRQSKTLVLQAAFRETWRFCPVLVIETVEDAWHQAERKIL